LLAEALQAPPQRYHGANPQRKRRRSVIMKKVVALLAAVTVAVGIWSAMSLSDTSSADARTIRGFDIQCRVTDADTDGPGADTGTFACVVSKDGNPVAGIRVIFNDLNGDGRPSRGDQLVDLNWRGDFDVQCRVTDADTDGPGADTGTVACVISKDGNRLAGIRVVFNDLNGDGRPSRGDQVIDINWRRLP